MPQAKRQRRGKTVELTIRVYVPKKAPIQAVKRAIADQWYGEVDVDWLLVEKIGKDTLYPKIVSARLASKAA